MWILRGATLLCLALTTVNVYLLHGLERQQATPDYRYDGSLPRPNQFIGLETVDRTRPDYQRPKPFYTPPMVMTQVDRTKEDFVFPDDTRRWLSVIGTVSPDDKHFQVTTSVSRMVSVFRGTIGVLSILDQHHSTISSSRLRNGALPSLHQHLRRHYPQHGG